MALPGHVQVKLSSEAAEYVAMTPVVVQDMQFRELLEHIASVARKQPERLREILKRGTLVSGASRFRWSGWELTEAELESALALLPDPEPERSFSAERCTRAYLTGAGLRVAVEREAGTRRRMFKEKSFWDALMEAAGRPAYHDYSYRERADTFRSVLGETQREAIRSALDLLKYKELASRLRMSRFDAVEWLVPR